MLIETKCINCGAIDQHEDSAAFRFCPYCGCKVDNTSNNKKQVDDKASTNQEDYYVILGISQEASADEILEAFREKARECHPDLYPGDRDAKARYNRIKKAYDCLSNPNSRARYDGNCRNNFGFGNAGNKFDFGDEFDAFFSGGLSGAYNHNPQKGKDIKCRVVLSPIEAMNGVTKSISFARDDECKACAGSGGTTDVCPTCKGTGKMRCQTQTLFGSTMVTKNCTRCQTRGYIFTNICPQCRSKGRLRTQQNFPVVIPCGVSTGSLLSVKGEGELGLNGGECGDLIIEIYVR